MDPSRVLRDISERLFDRDIAFAVAGATAGNLYRTEVRATNDIDFIIDASEEIGQQILAEAGFSAEKISLEELQDNPKKSSSKVTAILNGRSPDTSITIGVDFLLPSLPWVPLALERATSHTIDFGTVSLPTITIEDYIVAKTYASSNTNLFKNLDDLQSVFIGAPTIDYLFLQGRLEELGLKLPKELLNVLPKPIKRQLS